MNPSHRVTRLPLARHLGVLCLSLVLGAAGGAWAQSRPNEATARQEASGDHRAAPPVADFPASKPDAPAEATLREHGSDRYTAIRRMRDSGTPGARALLLEIGLGLRGPSHQEWAARCYLQLLSQRRGARALLDATDYDVVGMGMGHLAGESIDGELLGDLQRLLEFRSSFVRSVCASVIQQAPTNSFPAETVQAVVASLATLQTVEGAQELTSYATEPVKTRTRAGQLYDEYIRCLASTPTIGLGTLQQETPKETGSARDCLIVARAIRGEWELLEEVIRILRYAPDPCIRSAGLRAFERHGTVADIAFLEELARTDPYRVRLTEGEGQRLVELARAAGMADSATNEYFPVRWDANRVIRSIRSRSTSLEE